MTERQQKRALANLLSKSASVQVRDMVRSDPNVLGQTRRLWFAADDDIDMAIKGHVDRNVPESERRLKDFQLAWLDQLVANDQIRLAFNREFFSTGDSREPEQARNARGFGWVTADRSNYRAVVIADWHGRGRLS